MAAFGFATFPDPGSETRRPVSVDSEPAGSALLESEPVGSPADGIGPVALLPETVSGNEAVLTGRAVAFPRPANVSKARRYARADGTLLSFAVVNNRHRLRGFEGDRPFVSASVVKVMLLAAELKRLGRENLPLDPSTAQTMEAMITVSDNEAADEIYYREGDAGLNGVADRAGLANFSVAGHWGNAQITASDMARFMYGLDRNLTGPDAGWGKHFLASITEEQRWGIPEVVGPGWRIFFKGGWRQTELGELVHQVALLRHRSGVTSSLAVLSDGQASQTEAIEKIRRIASILFGAPPGNR